MFLSGGRVTRWHQLDTITHPHNNIVISAPTFITVWLCDLLRINLEEMLMRAAATTTTPTRSNDLCAFRPCNARVGGWACELLINCDERTVRQGMIYAIPGGKLFIFCLPQHYHLFIFHSIHMDDFILFGHQCGSEELTLVAIYFHISVNIRSPGRLVGPNKP